MKRLLPVLVLLTVTVCGFAQSFGKDGIIESISKDGRYYHLVMHPYSNGDGFEVYEDNITIQNNKVTKIVVRTYQDFLNSIIQYFELQIGLRNLAESNIVTAVYRTNLYEYRITKQANTTTIANRTYYIDGKGTMVIELIKK